MILSNLHKRFYTSLILFLLILLIFNFNFILVYFLLVGGVLSILEFVNITKKLSLNFFVHYLMNIFFIFYIFTFCVYFLLFSNISGLKIILLILLLTCVASDIGGYIFGKIFKGPKLTKISPNKTYSGALGSLFFSVVIVLLLSLYYEIFISVKLIIFAILTSIFCQIGDLFFSLLKRKAKLEDTGNILPGHGGILDRLDGLLLGIPLGFVTFIILN